MPIQALLDSVCCGLRELWEKLHADILFVVGYISEEGVSLADVDAAALHQVLDWFCFVHLEVILLLGQLGDIAWTCANGYGNLLEFVLDFSKVEEGHHHSGLRLLDITPQDERRRPRMLLDLAIFWRRTDGSHLFNFYLKFLNA